jgi:MFS superfamily sulfate permease-like transporter
MAVAILIVFILFIVGMVFAIKRQLNNTNPIKTSMGGLETVSTTQESLPYEDINDDMIILGGFKYRAVVKCTSINYKLRTEEEQNIVELTYRRFIDSLTFPIIEHVQTKLIDNDKIVKILENDLDKTSDKFPGLDYIGVQYIEEMSNIFQYLNNNKQKEKYIIIPYDDARNLTKLSSEEKYGYAKDELDNRASMIIDGLSTVGDIQAKRLNTEEIEKLLFASYHRDNHYFSEYLNEYTDFVVHGEKKGERCEWD